MCEEKRLLSCAVNPARDLLLKNRSKEAYWKEYFLINNLLFFFPLFLLKKEVGFGATPQESPKKRKGKNVFTRREQQEHNAEGDSRGV